MNEIGDKIKFLRKKYKLNQAELGKMCGITGQMISKIETNSAYPSLETLNKLSSALNCSISELTNESAFSGNGGILNNLTENYLQTINKSNQINKMELLIENDVNDTLNKFLLLIDDVENISDDPYISLKILQGKLSMIDRYIDIKLKNLDTKINSK